MNLLNKARGVIVKKPTTKQFIIPAIILIVCMIVGGMLLEEGKRRSIDPPKISFVAPGSTEISLDEVGCYTIYIETQIQHEGKQYTVPDGSIEDIEIKVSKNGQGIPVRQADIFYTYDKDGNKGQTNSNFDITEAGEYVIDTNIESKANKQIVLSVGIKNEQMLRVLQFTVGASVILLVGIIQFIGYTISGLIRWLMYKKSNHI